MRVQLIQARLAIAVAVASTTSSFAAVGGPAPTNDSRARKVVAVFDSNFDAAEYGQTIGFYDVTDLSGSGLFSNGPLFRAWVGGEFKPTGYPFNTNFEEVSGLTVNPINGTLYTVGYDNASTPAEVGVVDGAGDTMGDYDIFRVNYQQLLNHHLNSGNPNGQLYGPAEGDYPSAINVPGAIQKIGEVGRTQHTDFFDPLISFVDPSRLLLIDDREPDDFDAGDFGSNDHQLRILQRVDGPASYDSSDHTGGFSNGSTEAWESEILDYLEMDAPDTTTGLYDSNPIAMTYVERDGVRGAWIVDNDGSAGDDIAFFQINDGFTNAVKYDIDYLNHGVEKFSFDADDIPANNDDMGDVNFVYVDENGDLIVGESNFGAGQDPKVIRYEVTSYQQDSDLNGYNEVALRNAMLSSLVSPPNDDDSNPTDGRYTAFDRGRNIVWYFEFSGTGAPDVFAFDLDTNEVVYEGVDEMPADFYIDYYNYVAFTRGDITQDGLVDADDIDRLYALIADPTMGGAMAAALGQEWYDLTGDNLLGLSDVDEIIRSILGTEYGDADLNGIVDDADLLALDAAFGSASGWAGGDFDGNGVVDDADLLTLDRYFGAGIATASERTGTALDISSSTVPEPTSLLLVATGAIAASIRRSR